MDSTTSIAEAVLSKQDNASINYEEAMNMLLKSLEKSEVFQLRKHITKMVLSVGVVLFALDIFILGYVISLVDRTSAIKENVAITQEYVIKEPIPEETEPVSNATDEISVDPLEEAKNIVTDEKAVSIAEEYYVRMDELMNKQECTEEWYLEYKKLINEYGDIVGTPDQLTDVFSDQDVKMMWSCVETETHGGSFASKVNVSNVIFNRLEDGSYGDTITEIITSPNQFAYNKVIIDESTKLAIEYAFQFPDTTQGALYFNAGQPDRDSVSRVYIFTDDIGHSFYKKTKTNYENKEETTEELLNDEDSVG